MPVHAREVGHSVGGRIITCGFRITSVWPVSRVIVLLRSNGTRLTTGIPLIDRAGTEVVLAWEPPSLAG